MTGVLGALWALVEWGGEWRWRLQAVGGLYFMGGAALGVFEGNFVQHLGRWHSEAKLIGISGIPVGIFLIVVVGFAVMGLGWVGAKGLYGVTALGCGIAVFSLDLFETSHHVRAAWEEEGVWSPILESAARSGIYEELENEVEDEISHWRVVVVCALTYFLNMAVVSAWSPGVLLYLYNESTVYLEFIGFISTSLFLAVFSSFGFVADLVSRKLVYIWCPEYPIVFLSLTLIGLGVLVCQKPLIAPLGTMFIFL
jgi:hypothetical protein